MYSSVEINCLNIVNGIKIFLSPLPMENLPIEFIRVAIYPVFGHRYHFANGTGFVSIYLIYLVRAYFSHHKLLLPRAINNLY